MLFFNCTIFTHCFHSFLLIFLALYSIAVVQVKAQHFLAPSVSFCNFQALEFLVTK